MPRMRSLCGMTLVATGLALSLLVAERSFSRYTVPYALDLKRR